MRSGPRRPYYVSVEKDNKIYSIPTVEQRYHHGQCHILIYQHHHRHHHQHRHDHHHIVIHLIVIIILDITIIAKKATKVERRTPAIPTLSPGLCSNRCFGLHKENRLSVRLPVCRSACLSAYLFVLPIHLCTSVCLSVYPLKLSVGLIVCLPACLPFCVCNCLF